MFLKLENHFRELFQIAKSTQVNGELTADENLADIGGVILAYKVLIVFKTLET